MKTLAKRLENGQKRPEIEVKLTDFGVVARRGLSKYDWPVNHAMGTRWMAPESQPEQGFHFDEKTDIYTFGCGSNALSGSDSRRETLGFDGFHHEKP